ncbi:MAG: DNA polymerase III subunit delta', partial [Prochlorococcaceae cyanobacterium ETNP7_MAG_30]|nr:DNA polymerase III subunit delta' [Prochlorococcaceae cyanobacterium ETNP7_MAG_30]
LLILLSAAPERLLSTIRSRCQQILFSRLDGDAMEVVLARVQGAEIESSLLGLDKPELLAMAGGSPGALLSHLRAWQLV